MDWKTFGEPSKFALDLAFNPDPDGGCGATPAIGTSWGSFRIWLNNRNLCEYRAQGELRDHVSWYLLPLLRWLSGNWDPIFHEERLPEAMESSGGARVSYWKALRAVLGDEDPVVEQRAHRWFDWWERHALRACRDGGLFPDVFLRRVQDYVEFSWANHELPGMPEDFYFTVPAGTAYRVVSEVAEPLHDALCWAAENLLAKAECKEFESLYKQVKAIQSAGRRAREAWFVPNGALASIDLWAEKVLVGTKKLFVPDETPLYVSHFSPAVAMFGTVSPDIGQADVDVLLGKLVGAWSGAGEVSELRDLTREMRLANIRAPHEDGYDLAVNLLDELALPEPDAKKLDIEGVLQRLGITVQNVDLADVTVRGVALVGENVRPTILVNPLHRMNHSQSGRRFTLAHELCHILHDREFGRPLSLVSGPWAPAAIEKRANAFAAMFLMPYELINRLRDQSRLSHFDTVEGVEYLAKTMETGVIATLEHLCNIGKIDEERREALRNEFVKGDAS